jgi:hypothetical protein
MSHNSGSITAPTSPDYSQDGATRWDDTEIWMHGGWVCAKCHTPVESEPCAEHAPKLDEMDNRTHQWKALGKPEEGSLCGLPAFHKDWPKVRTITMVPDPREITCGDCRYLMQKIEGGPIRVI